MFISYISILTSHICTAQITITVNSDTICEGNSTTLTAVGATTYTWSPATGLSTTTGSMVVANPTVTTIYTIIGKIGAQSDTTMDTVTVNTLPYVYISLANTSNAAVTCGTPDTLIANSFTAISYTWNTGSIKDSLAITPKVTTTYTVIGIDANGCIGNTTATIDVSPFDLFTSSYYGTILCSTKDTLHVTNDYQGLGTVTYTWSPSTALSSIHSANPIASPLVSTNYAITASASDGCTATTNDVFETVTQLQINTAGLDSAICHAMVNLGTSSNCSNPNLIYSWSPSVGLSSATIASPNAIATNITYNVTMVLPSSGCQDATNSVSIALQKPSTPQICMVTVDSTSTYNIVYWDKTSFIDSAIDSFKIYREISTNVYARVGSVAFDSLSAFNDYGANPNITTYRYKLSTLDSCGNESDLSPYHNTVYVISVGGGQFTWNPGYTIEPNINPVTNYVLMRDDFNTGNFQQIAITAGSQNSINDVNYATYQTTANWRVDAEGFNCNPTERLSGNNSTMAAKVKSHSNQNNNRGETTAIKKTQSSQTSVYPNPATNVLNIYFAEPTTNVSVKITSLLGSEVYIGNQLQVSGNNLMLDISGYDDGTYLVQITTDNISEIKKIVKQ
jgi:type IX secretion system substrate protein